MRQLLSLLALMIGAAFLAPVSSGSADAAQISADEAESQFLAQLNSVRASAGVAPLVLDRELTDLSRGWAQSMAEAGQISHASPISAGLTAPWLKLGENVGTGGDVQSIMDAFVASPGHYANIVDPEFTHVGVAVIWVGPQLYTTHRFMLLQDVEPELIEPTPAPIPEPQASSAPITVPEPTPTTAPPSSTIPPLAFEEPEEVPATQPPQADPERVTAVLNALRLLDA